MKRREIGYRLRPPEEIKKRVTGDISKLNARLLRVSRRLLEKGKAHPAMKSVPGRILASFFRKAANTFEGMELLKHRRLIEEAWILLRVLLEAHVNFVYFVTHDGKEMTYRYLDASILDKLKHLREVYYYEGTGITSRFSREQWESREAEIKARYSSAEFAALRKHGFSGLSFEQRAKAVNMEPMYQYCYRIASRSVHTFDPADTLFSEVLGQRSTEMRGLLKARRAQLEANQNMLLGRLAYFVSEVVDDALLSTEVVLLGLGYEKFRDGVGPLMSDEGSENLDRDGTQKEDAEEGTFRIWRL